MTVFLKEQTDKIISEEFSWNDFKIYIDRKLKGYSHGEIDYLASKATNLNTHTDKQELLVKIYAAKDVARDKLHKTTDPNDRRELLIHMDVLKTLEGKVKAFNIVDHLEKHKEDSVGKGDSEDSKEIKRVKNAHSLDEKDEMFYIKDA